MSSEDLKNDGNELIMPKKQNKKQNKSTQNCNEGKNDILKEIRRVSHHVSVSFLLISTQL